MRHVKFGKVDVPYPSYLYQTKMALSNTDPEFASLALAHTGTQWFRPVSFKFVERKNRLLTREQNDCVRILFCFRRERNRSADMFSICLLRRERKGTIPYRSTFRITFLGTKRLHLKSFCLNATLQRSTFRNNMERSGTIAFPCERGLRA